MDTVSADAAKGAGMKMIKTLLRPGVRFARRKIADLTVRYFSTVARTGDGSDACLRLGFLPMPVNYYSPVPDLADLEQRKIWDRRSDLAGIDFHPDRQAAFLLELGRQFGDECRWPPTPTGEPEEFYTENNSFGFGCAAGVHCIIRRFKPRRVIEVGSGQSSKVIAAALRLNAETMPAADYTIIDPYPAPFLSRGLAGVSRVTAQQVERCDVALFETLSANDLLFIDSGHTVRIGGDVNFLILDVLPRLAPGVIIHFHDVNLPYEYSKSYATNPNFRMFWTEAYLLQAFLSCNNQFEILMAMAYLMTEQKEAFRRAFPHYDPLRHQAMSGSFWIRRK
jgi:hypothetical protein